MTNFEEEVLDILRVISIHLATIATVEVRQSNLGSTDKDKLLDIITKAQTAIGVREKCPWTNKEQSK